NGNARHAVPTTRFIHGAIHGTARSLRPAAMPMACPPKCSPLTLSHLGAVHGAAETSSTWRATSPNGSVTGTTRITTTPRQPQDPIRRDHQPEPQKSIAAARGIRCHSLLARFTVARL